MQRETVRRQIPTVYGFHMRRMTSLGASGSTYEPEILIIPGIGKNSQGYDLPYNESQSGKCLSFLIIYILYTVN